MSFQAPHHIADLEVKPARVPDLFGSATRNINTPPGKAKILL